MLSNYLKYVSDREGRQTQMGCIGQHSSHHQKTLSTYLRSFRNKITSGSEFRAFSWICPCSPASIVYVLQVNFEPVFFQYQRGDLQNSW